ncbi:MAG: GGDEF domain-containing protein, partial [Alphaproteobacteria bacterium]|nr:GGDEF domain-containing protein [Alphaproteobacteria bacterium]
EKRALGQLMKVIATRRAAVDQAMNLVVEIGNSPEALPPMRAALVEQTEILEALNAFVKVVERESDRQARVGERAIQATRRNAMILSAASVMLAILIGIMVAIREHRQVNRLRDQRNQLAKLSTTDALTCISNRRRFDEFLDFEWRRAIRLGHPLSLILIDIDHFKNFNDTYGHARGDDCLSTVSCAMGQAVVRSTDLLARYGGEEFACVLPETHAEGAFVMAEKLRQAVMGINMPHEGSSAAKIVTVSIGVATMTPEAGDHTSLLFAEADANLYRAKSDGRNRVYDSREKEAA